MNSALIFYNITMINIQIWICESELNRVEFNEEIHRILGEWNNQNVEK